MGHAVHQRVVKRCLTIGFQRAKRSLQVKKVCSREVPSVQGVSHCVIELDDDEFILWMAPSREGEARGNDLSEFFAHASGVVNHERDADGNVLAAEGGDVLRTPFVKDHEMFARKTRDQ